MVESSNPTSVWQVSSPHSVDSCYTHQTPHRACASHVFSCVQRKRVGVRPRRIRNEYDTSSRRVPKRRPRRRGDGEDENNTSVNSSLPRSFNNASARLECSRNIYETPSNPMCNRRLRRCSRPSSPASSSSSSSWTTAESGSIVNKD